MKLTAQNKKMITGAALIIGGLMLWKRNQSKGIRTPILDRKTNA